MITETSQCLKRPASGALNGLLLAQKRENGRIPSRPSSWTTILRISIKVHANSILVTLTATLGEDDTEDVPKCRKSDKNGQSAFYTTTEHISEERSRENAARRENFFFGDCGEVGDLRCCQFVLIAVGGLEDLR
jgi:hypothetical protein